VELDMLEMLGNMEETDPGTFGFVVGLCVGMIISALIAIIIVPCFSFWEKKAELKMEHIKSAVDFLGKNAVFDTGTLRVEGEVVSIYFDTLESELITMVYLKNPDTGYKIKIDYAEDGKYLFIKNKGE
jgi:hypothetical protein